MFAVVQQTAEDIVREYNDVTDMKLLASIRRNMRNARRYVHTEEFDSYCEVVKLCPRYIREQTKKYEEHYNRLEALMSDFKCPHCGAKKYRLVKGGVRKCKRCDYTEPKPKG